MIEPLPTILIVASLLFGVVAGVYVVLGRSPDNALVGLAGLLELGFLAGRPQLGERPVVALHTEA